MSCNKKTIPEFTLKQIVECKVCRHISGRKIWCGWFGVYIDRPRIATPSKRIIRPFPENNKQYNKDRFKREYVIAVDMARRSNKVIVNETIFIGRRNGCVICPPEDKQGCPCVGCKRWQELVFEEMKCPKGRWQNGITLVV